jgi:wobble nucleotide-excising tRNase
MITKIQRLRNIGKFYSFSAKSNTLDWHKNTFVFAPNAYGKSTLVDSLRSLRDNDPNLIRARRTLGALAAPEAVIVIDGANHCFNGTRWNSPFPSIHIFDAPFIHTNILTDEIGHDHKKNIHRIIIGANGIGLAEQLADLKTKEKAKRLEVAKLAEEYKQGGFSFPLDEFFAIRPEEEAAVDLRIQKLEQDIKSKESEAVIQGLSFPHHLTALAFDLSTVKGLASKKLTAVHEAAAEQVLDHIDRNFKDPTQARKFIRQGLELIQADCPICGQDLTNAAGLLKAYRDFFDDSFRTYQQSVAQEIALLEKWNLDNELTMLVSNHNENRAALSQWDPYLGAIDLPDVAATVEKCRPTLAELKGNILSEVEKKQGDPNADADLSHFDALWTELAELNSVVNGYNAHVTGFTDQARQYRAQLPKSGVATIRAELAKDQQIKMRFAPQWKKWATDYPIARKDADTFLTHKNAKQKELEDYGKTIFNTYQERINELLLTLGTDFAITGLTGKTDERANESYSDFAFLILQKVVPLTTRQGDMPCFRNTLSEGDKSTLAFAFFIAAVERSPELDKQIVVFDDPLSSLDETRREATARLLLALSPKVTQLNVFTHKKDFLYMLCDKMPDSKVLQVRSDKKHGSRLEAFDVEGDRKSEYVHILEDMARYLTEDFGPTSATMQGNIRNVFEVVLKTKYYRTLAAQITGKQGLATLLQALFHAGLLDVALKPRMFDLCNVTNGPHHGEIVDAPSKRLTRDELIPLIGEALSLIEHV